GWPPPEPPPPEPPPPGRSPLLRRCWPCCPWPLPPRPPPPPALRGWPPSGRGPPPRLPRRLLRDLRSPCSAGSPRGAPAACVVELHALEQALLLLGRQRAQDPHRVLALQAEAGMHQAVGQFARTGEQQQALGVQVQPADRLPLALVQLGQLAKDGRAVLRIVV